MKTKHNNPVLVNLQDICVHRQGEVVLDHIDLVVHSEEIVTLIGPNGAGKSTLTKIALRLIKPDTGQVWVQSGLRIGYVPQTIDLDPTLPISTRRFMQLSGSSFRTADTRSIGTGRHPAFAGFAVTNGIRGGIATDITGSGTAVSSSTTDSG